MTMVVFTVVFKKIANMPSENVPYPIFAYTALLPWNLFSGALSRTTTSVVGQSNLISKVYFPRLIVPLSATISGVVDFTIAFVIMIAMMIWYGIAPTWGVLSLPVFIILALSAAFAVGLWLSALNVKYRDVGHTIPFIIQLWLFASPVAYSVTMIPEKWQILYSLNPMTGVIEAFRWALLGKQHPDFGIIAISAGVVLIVLLGGLVYFKRTERTFADIV
jgi:lipopolysaccharide transport system permease protein